MIPLALFALALIVRLYRLSYLDVWFDEVAILFQIQGTFPEIWNFCKAENFPPLYSWLLKVWSLGGGSDGWLRLLSALLGALIPPLAYAIGKELKGRRLGLWLGLACLLSLPLYYYSQIIRMYSLFVLLACLSYYGFLRALATGRWKYWFLTALANLLGFYAFLFMSFVVLSEFLVLAYSYRFEARRYWRPVLAHLPAIALMSFWMMTLLTRYRAQQSYVPSHLSFQDLIELWIYFGTGYKAPHQELLMAAANLPFALGLILGLRKWFGHPPVTALVLIAALSLLLICGLSIIGQSIFFDRYMLFLLPIYLALALMGWMELASPLWRKVGLVWFFGALLFSQGYYWTHYHAVNDEFRHHGVFVRPADDDGRSMSRTAAALEREVGPDEVIIHYSSHFLKDFSYFNFVYFHNRALPEYIYSTQDIPEYAGRQYLHAGDHIRSLRDLPRLPEGIWVITLNQVDILLQGSAANQEAQKIIVKEGDLPGELVDDGYVLQHTSRDGAVSVAHFRKLSGLGASGESGRRE